MSKNIWRCRCGKRVEMLTDENFGDCGCSDPVYGPEYFYMSKECADMLDEMDKDYDEQHKHLEEARAEIENLKWHINSEKAKAEAALALNDRALGLVNEARADAEHWKSECNALQRMVHEARAEIKLKNEELDMFLAEQQAMGEIIERKGKLIEQMREALRFVYRFKVGLSFNKTPAGIEASRVICAALEAAERGE